MTETNVNVELETNEETVELTVIGKAYNVSDKGNVSMLGTVRTELQKATNSNLETIDLSTYELVGNKTLVKQIAVCGTTEQPVYLKIEMTYTNTHPSNLAPKKKGDKKEKSTTTIPSLTL
jgi:hypothetical protein